MPRNGCVYLLIVQVNVVSSTRRITFTFGAEPRTMNHERQCCLPNCYIIGVYRCSGCQSAYYCREEHQHLDWERHKLGCFRDSGDNGDFGLFDGGSSSTVVSEAQPDFWATVRALEAVVQVELNKLQLIGNRVYVVGPRAVSILCLQQKRGVCPKGELDFAHDPYERADQLWCDVVVLTEGSVRRKPVVSESVRITFVSGGTGDELARAHSFAEFVTSVKNCPEGHDVLGILLVNALSVGVELPFRYQLGCVHEPLKPLLSVSGATFWKHDSLEGVCVLPMGGEPGIDLGVESYPLKTRGRAVLELALLHASADLRRAVEPPWVLILWRDPIVYPCSVLTPPIAALVSTVWWWSVVVVGKDTIRSRSDVGSFVNALDANALSQLRRTVQACRSEHNFPTSVTKLCPADRVATSLAPALTVSTQIAVSVA